MKKLIFTALIAVSMISSAFALPVNVNLGVKQTFETMFPKAGDAEWVVTTDYTKATFVNEGTRTEVFFSPDGDLIGTSHAISLDQLPTSAKRAFTKKYSDYTVKEAIQFDTNDETGYYISAENDRQSVIIKVSAQGTSVYKTTAKK